MTLTPPDLSDCLWPDLEEPYASVLREATIFVLSEYDPIGIVVGGSVLRGQGDARSDLDVYVIHQSKWRQRVQKIVNGVPIEIFVNPPVRVRRYFVDERTAGRPITAHLLTTGFVVLEWDESVGQLRAEAAVALAQRPDLTPQALEIQRYLAVDLLDNVADVAERAQDTALFVLEQAMQRMIAYAYLAANHNLPRLKEALDRLVEVDAELQALARCYYTSENFAQKHAAALAFAQQTLGITTFFEWASQPEEVSIS
jgi:predicted nucleotidyltransferase